jgi:Cdc6-like AAA superfamily ATPase
MIKELTEYYEPKKVVHRKNQIESIRNLFKNFKIFGISKNILIRGYTGSGKTTVVSRVIKEEEGNYVIANGSETKTTFKTLKCLFDVRCNTSEKLIGEAVRTLKENPKVIVIDEVNKVRDSQNLYGDLNTIYRRTGCPIILITNKINLITSLPDDVRLTLFFERVEFPSYNALELYDIVKERIDEIKKRMQIPKIPEGSLRKICAIGGKEASARTVLNITLRCLQTNNFSEDYIDEVNRNFQREDLREFILGLNHTEKEFLKNLVFLGMKKKEISASEIWKTMSNLTPARISQLIDIFQNEHQIIKSFHRNLGRSGGRSRIVKFVSEDIYFDLENAVEDHELLVC